MEPLSVLDLPQLHTKPSADALLRTLDLLAVAPPSWEQDVNNNNIRQSTSPRSQVAPEGVTRYLTSIVSSSLKWIHDEDAKEDIRNKASVRLSERSGRTAMGALSRTFRIPTSTGAFNLLIHEPALTGDDLGLKTWAASYLLAKRLHTFELVPADPEQRLQVLELGSGTGLVGLAMATLGADVLLTDLPNICPNLARNVRHNEELTKLGGGSTRTAVLDWENPTCCEPFSDGSTALETTSLPRKFSLILAADSLYSSDHPRMLVDTIQVWLSDDAHAKVIVEFPYRHAYLPEIEDFRQRMADIGLYVLEESEEKGYDDWGETEASDESDESALVTCWWSSWARRSPHSM